MIRLQRNRIRAQPVRALLILIEGALPCVAHSVMLAAVGKGIDVADAFRMNV